MRYRSATETFVRGARDVSLAHVCVCGHHNMWALLMGACSELLRILCLLALSFSVTALSLIQTYGLAYWQTDFGGNTLPAPANTLAAEHTKWSFVLWATQFPLWFLHRASFYASIDSVNTGRGNCFACFTSSFSVALYFGVLKPLLRVLITLAVITDEMNFMCTAPVLSGPHNYCCCTNWALKEKINFVYMLLTKGTYPHGEMCFLSLTSSVHGYWFNDSSLEVKWTHDPALTHVGKTSPSSNLLMRYLTSSEPRMQTDVYWWRQGYGVNMATVHSCKCGGWLNTMENFQNKRAGGREGRIQTDRKAAAYWMRLCGWFPFVGAVISISPLNSNWIYYKIRFAISK